VVAERAFSSPWTLSSPYWIVIAGEPGKLGPWAKAVMDAGLQPLPGTPHYYAIQTTPEWATEWERITSVLTRVGDEATLKAAIIASDTAPSTQEITFNLRPIHAVQEVVEHLWLLDHLSEDRLLCYFQRVVDRRNKQVGFEAFARIAQGDGSIIGGAAIMRASHALKVEYQVDRRMHIQAIDTFAACDLDGYIFINFLTGFIHRPEVYLEGLSQAVERHHLMPRNVALDVPLTDYVRDIAKLRSIAQYCHQRGFALSLDDVLTPEGLPSLLADIRPAIVKLDGKLGQAFTDVKRQGTVLEIIRIAHSAGALVLAEGVEDATLFDAYLAAGVDMFQGYHIGAPELFPPRPGSK